MKVPYWQAIERTGRRGSTSRRPEAVDGEARSTRARTKGCKGIQRLRAGHDNRSIMVYVDGHRACFFVQAKPNTYVEVPDEVLGHGYARNEASGIGVAGRSGEDDERGKHEFRSIVAVCFSPKSNGIVHEAD